MEFTKDELNIIYETLDYYVRQLTNDFTENLGLMKREIDLLDKLNT